MNRIVRVAAPLCLSHNSIYKNKCKRWQNRIAANPNSQFAWGKFQGEKINKLLIEALSPMTLRHCAFCDISKVMKGGVRPTIEHYAPKRQRPLLAFVWYNLFLCCDQCQEYKNSQFHKDLIKPDRTTYEFDHYFILDFATGEILHNPAYPQNQSSAIQTINLYGLNRDSRPELRLREVDAYNETILTNRVLDDFSYRFFISRS